MKKPIYQMSQQEANASGRAQEWQSTQQKARQCAQALSNSFFIGTFKRQIHWMISIYGLDVVSLILASEIRMRKEDEAIFARFLEWAGQERFSCNEAFVFRWGMSSVSALLVVQYVVMLESLKPRELLTEKITVELASWCGSLPDDTEKLLPLSEEMWVYPQCAALLLEMEMSPETVERLLCEGNTLERCCHYYFKRHAQDLKPQLRLAIADVAAPGRM